MNSITYMDGFGRTIQTVTPMDHDGTANDYSVIEQSGGIDTYLAYDNLKTTVTDPDGHTKTQVTDMLGRILTVTEHGGPSDHVTTYTYNLARDLTRVARNNPITGNAINNVVAYNTLGQKVSMTDPDMGTWSYTYDKNWNLKPRPMPETLPLPLSMMNSIVRSKRSIRI